MKEEHHHPTGRGNSMLNDPPAGKESHAPSSSRLHPTTATTTTVALRLENVKKVFDSRSASAKKVVALDGISFEIKKGEFVSIVGPSGSGKSTLLNIIGALDRPTAGKVFINGQDIFLLDDTRLSDIRNRLIGFIFQSYNLVNRMSVQENVEFPAVFSPARPSSFSFDKSARALELLEILGIKDKAKQKPVDLSGGEQQRVAIARALINDPALVLADEPTGNLDTKTGREVFDLLRMLSDRFGTTVVMVTHNLELAGMTDKSIYIRDGRVEKEEKCRAPPRQEPAKA
ncbi:ABC efflux transporter, ATP-binding protein [Candidatus Nitrososphaera gargensis Ga9.2]|uniref:ABC efflux transporter, ATP-binding protein n=1 Tax=Nitrososphaera gargensis (strain Ga9.2) TaxID=1237085 RepID=K0IFV5_NITGG|nr:ABC transporter ATP-binding protein [Candidatus Nitrososphaera gargensis]AFU60276.1 ABC efflux transporter, ATP-binding protein [Candidatus Nitrososphaera gargensis Ga9.2]